ncbi:MAG: M14 family zinc carboxypeptidase [Acidobacteriota bacterium]|nr:M14 family zinc carboxypeptidase [Acidobacteriota bacterium]
MDTIDQLTDNYGTDPRITSMVDTYQIWCVPMVNPDGVARVHEVDDNWRKNLRDNDGNGAIDSQDGVDLNRNYQWGWGGQCRGSSSLFASATYRGPRELSEPESQALIEWGRTWRPVFDVEYHAYGEDVFYALSCDPSLSPTLSTIPGGDPSISRVIAEDYAARLVQADGGQGFSAAPYGSRVDGTGRDNQYRENGSIAFVTEVNNAAEGGFRPDYGTYRDATVQGQRPGWKWLIERMGGPAVGGHVTDALTGRPLEAEISLDEMNLPDGRQPTSRADTGRFHLIVVPGDYTLRVRAPGYAEAVIPVTVADAPYVPLGVALEPAGANVLAREDFEDPATALAWTSGFPGDTATDGRWQWGEPQGTHDGDAVFGDLEFGAPRFDGTPGRGVNAWGHGQPGGGRLHVRRRGRRRDEPGLALLRPLRLVRGAGGLAPVVPQGCGGSRRSLRPGGLHRRRGELAPARLAADDQRHGRRGARLDANGSLARRGGATRGRYALPLPGRRRRRGKRGGGRDRRFPAAGLRPARPGGGERSPAGGHGRNRGRMGCRARRRRGCLRRGAGGCRVPGGGRVGGRPGPAPVYRGRLRRYEHRRSPGRRLAFGGGGFLLPGALRTGSQPRGLGIGKRGRDPQRQRRLSVAAASVP